MTVAAYSNEFDLMRITDAVRRYWGFDSLRPLQEAAIRAGLVQRDSLVVLPTGGGKSLCYQVPPILTERTDVVVSPLISLMKDQVDALRQCGYPAAAMHSGATVDERRQTEREIAEGKYRLIFVAPERILTPWFLRLLQQVNVRSFAIDEAHCISHWGHDFRPEYRKLASLKEHFPQASLHAFTATATQQVRQDIVDQLRLRDPTILVGNFDRPNLVYRIIPRVDEYEQVLTVLRRHKGEAVIIYCISRRDTEQLAEFLKTSKIRAEHYHAGMDAVARRQTQDAFAAERIDVVVATVAFGMGIDRSNVRCVIHTAAPKSIEHYQQETGRAGRDGLEAECVMLYSVQDMIRWQELVTRSAQDAARPQEVIAAIKVLLGHMRQFCNRLHCRHCALVEYFGQQLEKSNCSACDVCLGEIEGVVDGTVEAQKILSCVARVQSSFGAKHINDILRGADTDMIRKCKHDQLSTYGLLRQTRAPEIRNMIYQLVDQELLVSTGGDRPVLQLNDESWAVMRGQRPVHFIQSKTDVVASAPADTDPWDGVDRGLFDHLRTLRADIAHERGVPAFVVFGDRTLREMARWRPSSPDDFNGLHGVGESKLADFGVRFAEAIASYCSQNGITMNIPRPNPSASISQDTAPRRRRGQPKIRSIAFPMFKTGESIDEVMNAIMLSRGTTVKYLVEFIEMETPEQINSWVNAETYQRAEKALRATGGERLAPAYESLNGEVDYDSLHLVRAHLRSRGAIS